MRFTERDGRILQAIQDYDGVLARRQIKQLFWPESSWRVLHRRLAYLHYHQYIAKPDLEDRKVRPIPEPVVWLDWRGALQVAGQNGLKVEPPNKDNENQLRKLERELHKAEMRWLREPLWSQLSHDLHLVDIRLRLEYSAGQHPDLVLEEWVNESDFRSRLDTVSVKSGQGGREKKRGVIPDGSFVVSDLARKREGKPHRARFLLEVDMATHDHANFGRRKAIPGAAYISSDAYHVRFGSNTGRWLVVTTGEVRMKNLAHQIECEVSERKNLFVLTTNEQFIKSDPLVDAIWWRAGDDTAKSLLR